MISTNIAFDITGPDEVQFDTTDEKELEELFFYFCQETYGLTCRKMMHPDFGIFYRISCPTSRGEFSMDLFPAKDGSTMNSHPEYSSWWTSCRRHRVITEVYQVETEDDAPPIRRSPPKNNSLSKKTTTSKKTSKPKKTPATKKPTKAKPKTTKKPASRKAKK